MRTTILLRWIGLLLCVGAALSAGCSGKQPRPQAGMMDTREHHFNVGLRFLEADKLNAAMQEFNLALDLDPKYPPTMAGKGAVMAAQGEADEGFDLIEDAVDEADDLGKKASPKVRLWPITLQLFALQKTYEIGETDQDDYADDVEDALEEAVEIDPNHGAPRFYAGEAYLAALMLTEAEVQYARALTLDVDGAYGKRADKRLRLVFKVRRAEPTSEIGKRIALVDEVSRADLAALMVEEIDIEVFYPKTKQYKQIDFEEPGASKVDKRPRAVDILDHPLRADIEVALKHGVKGIELLPGNRFFPDAPVTRVETAMALEDILVRASGREELAVVFVGEDSPFADLRGDHPGFNAAMTAVTRGLMDAETDTGLFKPEGPMAGVDALLSLQNLKRELRLF